MPACRSLCPRLLLALAAALGAAAAEPEPQVVLYKSAGGGYLVGLKAGREFVGEILVEAGGTRDGVVPGVTRAGATTKIYRFVASEPVGGHQYTFETVLPPGHAPLAADRGDQAANLANGMVALATMYMPVRAFLRDGAAASECAYLADAGLAARKPACAGTGGGAGGTGMIYPRIGYQVVGLLKHGVDDPSAPSDFEGLATSEFDAHGMLLPATFDRLVGRLRSYEVESATSASTGFCLVGGEWESSRSLLAYTPFRGTGVVFAESHPDEPLSVSLIVWFGLENLSPDQQRALGRGRLGRALDGAVRWGAGLFGQDE